MCSKCMVGRDGKTLYERRRERNATWLLCHLENVYCTDKSGKARIAGPSSRLRTKIWLGHNRRTNEALIGTRRSVVWACFFCRRDDASRWSPPLISGMKGTPKQPDPSRLEIHIPIKMLMIGPEHVQEPVAVEGSTQ